MTKDYWQYYSHILATDSKNVFFKKAIYYRVCVWIVLCGKLWYRFRRAGCRCTGRILPMPLGDRVNSGPTGGPGPTCGPGDSVMMMMIRQFIRRGNMSTKSLQGCHTPGSRDECRTVPDDRRPLNQAHGLEPLARLYCRQLRSYIHYRNHYYSARKLILILPSHRG